MPESTNCQTLAQWPVMSSVRLLAIAFSKGAIPISNNNFVGKTCIWLLHQHGIASLLCNVTDLHLDHLLVVEIAEIVLELHGP